MSMVVSPDVFAQPNSTNLVVVQQPTCVVVRDHDGQKNSPYLFEGEPARRSVAPRHADIIIQSDSAGNFCPESNIFSTTVIRQFAER